MSNGISISGLNLECEDCVNFLANRPDESADLVIADPPYNIGFDGGCDWDRVRPESEWVAWCLEWTRECARILRPGRMLVVWGTLKDSNQFLKYRLAVDDDGELGRLLVPENEIVWFYRRGLRVPPLQSRAVRHGSSGG